MEFEVICLHLPLREFVICKQVCRDYANLLSKYEKLYLKGLKFSNTNDSIENTIVKGYIEKKIVIYMIYDFLDITLQASFCVDSNAISSYQLKPHMKEIFGVQIGVLRERFPCESVFTVPVHVIPGQFYCSVRVSFFLTWKELCAGIQRNFFSSDFPSCSVIATVDNNVVAFVCPGTVEESRFGERKSLGFVPSSILVQFREGQDIVQLNDNMKFSFEIS